MEDEKCFAKTERGCSVLTKCKCEGCNFCKTKEQLKKEIDAANERNAKRGIVPPKGKQAL